MDGAREIWEGGSERRRIERGSEQGSKGAREGGKLQGRYPDEGTARCIRGNPGEAG